MLIQYLYLSLLEDELDSLLSDIRNGRGTSDRVSLGTYNALKEAIRDKDDITVEISISNLTPNKDQRLINSYLGDKAEVVRFFDLRINILVDGKVVGTLNNLDEKVEIEVTDITGTSYYVYRVHDDKVEYVDRLYDRDSDKTYEFETDAFSTYAIIRGNRIVVDTSAR